MRRPSLILTFTRLNIEWLAPQSGEAGLAQQNGQFFCLSSPGRLQDFGLGCQGPQRLLPPVRLPGGDFGQLMTTAGQGISPTLWKEILTVNDLVLCNARQAVQALSVVVECALWLNLSDLLDSERRLNAGAPR